jgi:hypothetical protein
MIVYSYTTKRLHTFTMTSAWRKVRASSYRHAYIHTYKQNGVYARPLQGILYITVLNEARLTS